MWFQFPEGAEGISVHQQNFAIEATDEKGRGYFRAPDHFADAIIGIPGFSIKEPENTDLPDLPKVDPLRDSAISELAKKADAAQEVSRGLREDLNGLSAEFRALKGERDALNTELEKTKVENVALRERIFEFESEQETREALTKKGTKPKSDPIVPSDKLT